jgi:periplasmic protein CpxP/Spy
MTRVGNALLAAVLLSGVAAIGTAPALAETAAAPGHAAVQSGERHEHGGRMLPSQLVEGRIAFLKAELKITPAEEPQWQQFAAVMRQNAQALDQAIDNARGHRNAAANALERMEMRAQFAKLRADSEARLVTVFRPLYASLSPEQQQVAGQLMAGHGWHHGWHHRA